MATDTTGSGFDASVHRYGSTRTVVAAGELDVGDAVGAFGSAVRQALDDRPEFLVLDLAAVAHVGVVGAHAIEQACRHAAAREARVTIIPPPDRATRPDPGAPR